MPSLRLQASPPQLHSGVLAYLCQLPVSEISFQVSWEDHKGRLARSGSGGAAAQHQKHQDQGLPGAHGEGGGGVLLQLSLWGL